MDKKIDRSKIIQHKKSDFLFTGFALFAMFFGAGNLIFPPELGVLSGTDWFLGFIGFFLADAGLATLGMFAMMRNGGDLHNITGTIGKVPGRILALVVVLCIGPCIAIPRTGTVTYSLGFLPITGTDPDNKVALAVFSVLFFLLVFALTITESKVVSILGKILTPLLLIALIALIGFGAIYPAVHVEQPISDNCIRDGISNGYQTMDAMASLLFAGIIIKSLENRGYNSKEVDGRVQLGRCSILACAILFVVYGGLTFIGAAFGGPWGEDIASKQIDQAQFLSNIVASLMGETGMYVISIIVLFACLTTAIGLTSSISEYFVNATNGKLPYRVTVLLICIVSALLCNIGLAQIIELAAPILSLVYPLVMVLMVLALFNQKLTTRYPHILGGVVALIVSAITVLHDTFGIQSLGWINSLPLAEYSFNWLIPTAIAVGIGLVIEFSKRKKA